MIVYNAKIQFKDILTALDVKNIPGCEDDAPEDWIEFIDCVEIDETEIDIECDICHGVEPEEPEPVNDRLIEDFVGAIQRGDIHTAQCLVGRVFYTPEDIALVDRALCRCAA